MKYAIIILLSVSISSCALIKKAQKRRTERRIDRIATKFDLYKPDTLETIVFVPAAKLDTIFNAVEFDTAKNIEIENERVRVQIVRTPYYVKVQAECKPDTITVSVPYEKIISGPVRVNWTWVWVVGVLAFFVGIWIKK